RAGRWHGAVIHVLDHRARAGLEAVRHCDDPPSPGRVYRQWDQRWRNVAVPWKELFFQTWRFGDRWDRCVTDRRLRNCVQSEPASGFQWRLWPGSHRMGGGQIRKGRDVAAELQRGLSEATRTAPGPFAEPRGRRHGDPAGIVAPPCDPASCAASISELENEARYCEFIAIGLRGCTGGSP